MTLETITTKNEKRQQKVFEKRVEIYKILIESNQDSFITFLEHYGNYPSARLMNEPEYSNFVGYKLEKAYLETRKEFPELPDLGVKSI